MAFEDYELSFLSKEEYVRYSRDSETINDFFYNVLSGDDATVYTKALRSLGVAGDNSQYLMSPDMALAQIVQYDAHRCFNVFIQEYYGVEGMTDLQFVGMVERCITNSYPDDVCYKLEDYIITLYRRIAHMDTCTPEGVNVLDRLRVICSDYRWELLASAL